MRNAGSALLPSCNFSTAYFAIVIACLLFIASPMLAQQALALITQPIDDSVRTVLTGNVHPLARAEYDQGEAPSGLMLHRMMLVLKRSDQQESALQHLIENQQNKNSASYHKWLTPAEFGATYGPADSDIAAVTNWLTASGFEVTSVSNGRTVIEFNGTAAQVKQAFGTAIHKYAVKGEEHWANVSNPTIPTALAPVVAGVNSLSGFRRKAQNVFAGTYSEKTKRLTSPNPDITFPFACGYFSPADACYPLSPYDFANIYDVVPLWTAATPINGTGQTIAIVGDTDINPNDAPTFWSLFGLGVNGVPMPTLNIIYNGPNPGINSDEPEADIDTQWSGAVAPGATIDFVTSENTETDAGVDLSAIYIVDNNLAPVMSESYGECELFLGNNGVAFYGLLWEQAAAQGITAMVSTGDQGSAVCDGGAAAAQYGLNVNGIGSTPWNVAVGGTDFSQYNNWSTYWNSTNNPTTQQSVKNNTYIPETTWNNSCTNSLLQYLSGGTTNPETNCNNSNFEPDFLQVAGGSGGESGFSGGLSLGYGWQTPTWQTGAGVPTSPNSRFLPDVSLLASNGFVGSLYVICQTEQTGPSTCTLDNLQGYGGTSVASPAFAGIMALVNQKYGPQGNANLVLYNLASKQPTAFHDVPTGSTIAMPCLINSPNCVTNVGTDNYGVLSGYATTAHYDLATGLGSVDADKLVTDWDEVTFTPTSTALTLSVPANTTHGAAVPVTVSVTSSAATGDVSLLVSPGTPGLTPPSPSIDWNTLGSNGAPSGTVSWSTTLLPGGTYTVVAHYAGDTKYGGSYSPASSSITINPEASSVYMPGVVTGVDQNTGQPIYSTSVVYGTGAFDQYLLRADVLNSAGSYCTSEVLGEIACPTGTINFTDNGGALDGGTFKLNSFGYTEDQGIQLTGGSHTLVANYSGDNSYKSSSISTSVTVSKATSVINNVQTTLSSVNTGQQFTVTATVNTSLATNTSYGLAPTGTVSFFYNTTQLVGTVQLTPTSGNVNTGIPASLFASLTTSISTAGTYNITATYSGDGNYTAVAAGQSNSVQIVVSAPTPGYSLSAGAANPVSVSPGGASTAAVSVTPANGYTGTVTLSCSISPVVTGVGAPTCSLSPNPVSVTSNGGSAALTFTTVAPTSSSQRLLPETRNVIAGATSNLNPAADPSRRQFQFFALWLPISGLALVGFVFRTSATQRRKMRTLCLLCLTSTALILLPSCGGGSSSSGCSAAPGVPTGLAASGTTNSGTTLSWTASTTPANCSLTGYTVYQNGTVITTTTSTTYNVTGLTAGTQYNFTVAARDSFGASAQSSPVSVTTTGTPGTPAGNYTISITGKDANGVTQTGAAATVSVTVN